MLAKFIRSDVGMETVEWALLGALLVVGVIAAAGPLGTAVKASFDSVVILTSP
jgi:Flp pilus assembly pilin Flp